LATLRGADRWRRGAQPPLSGRGRAAGHRRLPVLRGHLSHVRLHHIADRFDERWLSSLCEPLLWWASGMDGQRVALLQKEKCGERHAGAGCGGKRRRRVSHP